MITLRFIWILLLLITSVSVFQIKNYVHNLDKEISELDKALLNNNKIIHVLEAEWSYLNNPIRLERLSGKYLNNGVMRAKQFRNNNLEN